MGFVTNINEKIIKRVEELSTQISKLNEELGIIDRYIANSLNQTKYVQFGYKKESESEIEKKLPNITQVLTDYNLAETINNINNEDIESLKSVANIINIVKKYIENLEKEIELLNYYNRIFNNPNDKLVIFDMGYLFKILNGMFDNTEEVNKALGIIISHNSKFMDGNKSKSTLMRQLSRYYKKDGTFKENEDYETYEKLMEELLLKDLGNDEEKKKTIKNFIAEAIGLLKNSNEKKKSIEKTNILIEEKDNILSDDDFELISLSRNLIENSNEKEFLEIKELLAEINYLLSHLDKITDEEEKKYYKEEIKNLIAKLRDLYSPYVLSKNEAVDENKFIFLLDEEYNSYIDSDTNKFEGNQRKNLKKIFEIISNLKKDSTLLPILPLYNQNPVFYKGYNNVCVAFSKLSDGKYLIIGAWAGEQSNHQTMNNRAKLNIEQINRIKNSIPEDLEEISSEHSKYYQQLFESKKDRAIK